MSGAHGERGGSGGRSAPGPMARFGEVIKWAGSSGKRIAVTVLGFALVAVGVVMLVVPGPGILAIIAGLAVLGTEYTWAKRALDEAKRRSAGAAKRFRRRAGDR